MSKESPDKRRLTSERIDEIREAYSDPGGTAVDMTNGEMVALCDMASAPSHEQPNTQKPGVLATSKEDTLESGLTGRRDGHSAPSHEREKPGPVETPILAELARLAEEEWDEQPSGESLLCGTSAVLDFLHMPEVQALFRASASSTTPPKDHFPYAENMVNAPRTLDKYKSTQPNPAPQRPVAWIATNGSGKVLHLSAADGWKVEVVQEQPNPAPQTAGHLGDSGLTGSEPAAAGSRVANTVMLSVAEYESIKRELAAERERADMNYEHCKLAERWRDDWHKVADERSAEIVRLSGELAAAEQDAVRWRRYQMERAGLPVSATERITSKDAALLPGLREALAWKPNTPQLENAMTYAWESALKSFIRAIENARSDGKGEAHG